MLDLCPGAALARATRLLPTAGSPTRRVTLPTGFPSGQSQWTGSGRGRQFVPARGPGNLCRMVGAMGSVWRQMHISCSWERLRRVSWGQDVSHAGTTKSCVPCQEENGPSVQALSCSSLQAVHGCSVLNSIRRLFNRGSTASPMPAETPDSRSNRVQADSAFKSMLALPATGGMCHRRCMRFDLVKIGLNFALLLFEIFCGAINLDAISLAFAVQTTALSSAKNLRKTSLRDTLRESDQLPWKVRNGQNLFITCVSHESP